MAAEKFSLNMSKDYHGLIGDAMRGRAVALLGAAFSEGYLDAGQHGERTERALTMRTADDMRTLLSDLPETITRTTQELTSPRRRRHPERALRYLLTALATALIVVASMGNGKCGGVLAILGTLAFICAFICIACIDVPPGE